MEQKQRKMAGKKTASRNMPEEKERKGEKTKEKELIFYLIIIVFLALMLPHLIRFWGGNTTLVGGQAYYHKRAAENILEGNFGTDNLVYKGRDFVFVPYHYLLAAFGYLTGMETASRLLPFVLGILSLVLFYHILKDFKVSPVNGFVISLLLIVSPPFIYLFTVSTPNCLSVFLILLGLFLFLKEKREAFILSIICFVLVSISGLFNALFVMAILLFFPVADKKNKGKAFIAVLILLAIYLIHPVSFYYNFEFPVKNLLKCLVSGLGAKTGFSAFSVILAVIGIFHSWKNKSRFYPLYLALVFIGTATFYVGGETNLYTNLILVLFAALGLQKLKTIKWRFLAIRNLAFIIIGCGLLFSTASYMDRLPKMLPDSSIEESLKWLNENSDANQLVLSHYSKGYWIESMAQRPVLLDGFSMSAAGFGKKYSDSASIFHNIDLDDTAELFRKYNISYIWIDNEMKQGLVWGKEKEGLLYLLRNNKTFKKAYANEATEVWKVLIY